MISKVLPIMRYNYDKMIYLILTKGAEVTMHSNAMLKLLHNKMQVEKNFFLISIYHKLKHHTIILHWVYLSGIYLSVRLMLTLMYCKWCVMKWSPHFKINTKALSFDTYIQIYNTLNKEVIITDDARTHELQIKRCSASKPSGG